MKAQKKKLVNPLVQDTPDTRAFMQFYREHVTKCITLARELAFQHMVYECEYEVIFKAILESTVSPIVYLYEYWDTLPFEEKMKYSKELEEIHREGLKIAEKIWPSGQGEQRVEAHEGSG
jgi:hypothetical protein